MDYQTILLALLFTSTLILISFYPFHGRKKLTPPPPPGPVPLPIIGNLHLLGNQPHKSLALLAQKYGPVMRLKLGMVNTVVISSSAMAREALQKQDLAFSSRTTPDALSSLNRRTPSVFWLPVAAKWRSLRTIMNTTIFSGSKLDANQELRARKIRELIMYCRKKGRAGEAVDIGREAFKTTLNLLANTIFSKDLTDPNSDSAMDLKNLVWNIMEEAGKLNLVDYFPFLGKLDPQGIRRRMSHHYTETVSIFKDLIDQRLEDRKVDGNRNGDVLDSLLGISEEKPEEFDRGQIERMCWDLFVAGTDTSSSTVEWAMAELLKNSEAMAKAQSELADVIGKGKLLNEGDVARLPYLQCIVKETFRLHPPTPLLIPRKVEQDVVLCEYTIPKGSKILINAWAIGHDTNLWDNPFVFNPERFWDSKIDVRGQDFELIPFGAGRRICPGLPMAVRMVPVMLGSLLNSFEWKIEGDITSENLDMEAKFGMTLAKAHPFRAIPIPIM
ncbi:PREDICTED: geraniol 8-hydroxylase-like [Ipomoea nil]|uniref:geraniol 8-hydroxylase-like n=1 Tax=Ipomoea nil TaxID=35883 RepID=UPI0009015292|nr:PREDICTED: geraniol 8-hydroxylase-like [Ipomoea nil]